MNVLHSDVSTSADDSCFSAAQSRRFACDRCHQHKLRCERSSIMANGVVAIPLGSCKRCLKAQVPCQVTASNNTGNASTGSKRKMSPIEVEKANERVSVTSSSIPFSSCATESVSCATSPIDSSMLNTDAASLLGLDSFDFGTGDFTDLNTTASRTSILDRPSITQGASDNDTLVAKDVQNIPDVGIPEAQYEGFIDLTLFGAATSHPDGSASTVSIDSLSSHITSSAPVSQPESPLATRDDCRRRLVELHSTIFNELDCITKADSDDTLFAGGCTSLVNPESGCRDNSIISRLLSASERLIELLGMLCVVFASQPGHRDRSASALTRGSPITSSPRFNEHSASSRSSSSLLHQSVRPGLPSIPTAGSSSDASSPSSSSPSSFPSSVDLPIIISFFTCYVGLLAVYRAVLTHILLSLQSPEQQSRMQSRGGSVSSRTASGRGSGESGSSGMFGMLQGTGSSSLQQVLRMRIQMEILTHMIERIEDAWVAAMMDGNGCDEDGQLHHHHHHHQQGEIGQGVGNGVLFRRAGTMELLQNMLVHEGFTWGDEGWRVGQGSLMGLLKRIRKLLRDGNFV